MILPLSEIDGHPVGGKARGLKILRSLGMSVPDACVLVHPHADQLDENQIRKHLAMLGDHPKAVRSSAVSEDGHEASFAGQFESYLNLSTFEEVHGAILQCIGSAGAERVASYSGSLRQDADLRLSVIVQNMVEASVAGVIFTANPANHRRDKVLINAVAGQGEKLVSGHCDAVRYEIFRSGSDCAREALRNGNFLDEATLKKILEGALIAERYFGTPVDMEWAIDGKGILYWLQVRPVTTLSEVHFNELDTVQGPSGDVYTLGNIGEMMPGVATPLTYSVSAEAIDFGMTFLADRVGAYRLSDRRGPRYIQMFYNKLFINMSHMMDYPKRVWLNTPEDVQFALSGKAFDRVTARPEIPFLPRLRNFLRQMISTARARKHLEDLRRLEASFRIESHEDPAVLHYRLGDAIGKLGMGFAHHLMTSAQSGTFYSAFMRILTGNKRSPEPADHHLATMLLTDIPEIESADAVKSLERFAGIIRHHAGFAGDFLSASIKESMEMLLSGPGEIPARFREFLHRHGHRCIRESELREKTWAEDPMQLIHTLRAMVKNGEVKHPKPATGKNTRQELAHLSVIKRMILLTLIPTARKAVARREITKALSIRMVDRMRQGYRLLAAQLAASQLLDDPDHINFLTHAEIGKLLADQSPRWKSIAARRREIHPELNKLTFPEISYGKPEPLEEEERFVPSGLQQKGIPVSSGKVTGRVRVIRSPSDAEALEEGEIMVAAFTDIGWTPYFSIAAGLITEIGSPLSHGAVVAREYGLPAIVGVKGVRNWLKTSDLILLDGNTGIIEKKHA